MRGVNVEILGVQACLSKWFLTEIGQELDIHFG